MTNVQNNKYNIQFSLPKFRLRCVIINMTRTCNRRYVVNYVPVLIIDICKVIVHQHVILPSHSPFCFHQTPYSKATTRNDRSVIRSVVVFRSPASRNSRERTASNKNYSFSVAGKALQSAVESINLSVRRLCRLPRGTKRHNDNATSKNGRPLHCAIISAGTRYSR